LASAGMQIISMVASYTDSNFLQATTFIETAQKISRINIIFNNPSGTFIKLLQR